MGKNLFGDIITEESAKSQNKKFKDIPDALGSQRSPESQFPKYHKEGEPLDRLKDLDGKIANALNKVKALKDEKLALERRVRELEEQLNEKNLEIQRLSSEKLVIKDQIGELLDELETLELGPG